MTLKQALSTAKANSTKDHWPFYVWQDKLNGEWNVTKLERDAEDILPLGELGQLIIGRDLYIVSPEGAFKLQRRRCGVAR